MSKINNTPDTEPEESTHFGYQTVSPTEKTRRVGQVFHSVANRYDVMNDLISMGTHRVIKRFTVELSGVRACSIWRVAPAISPCALPPWWVPMAM